MANKRPGCMLYFKIRPLLEKMTNEERGIIVMAMLDYAERGKKTVLPERLDFVWPMIAYDLDSDAERYAEICEKRSAAAKCYSRKCSQESSNASNCLQEPTTETNNNTNNNTNSNTNSNTNNKADKPQRVFKKPTLQEVKEYCTEKGFHFDPEEFIDHYDANGWKVGKAAMKDWKAACRTWERRNTEYGCKSVPGKDTSKGTNGRFDGLQLYDA